MVSHSLTVFLKDELQFQDLNVNLLMITFLRSLNLSAPISGDAHNLLNLDEKLPYYVILNIFVDIYHVGRNKLKLWVPYIARFLEKPTQNLLPIQLKHFNFGVSVNFSIDELFLYKTDMAIHDPELPFEI